MATAYQLGELAERLGGEVRGDPERWIRGVATLDDAGADDLSFLTNPRYRAAAAKTRAHTVLISDSATFGRAVLTSEKSPRGWLVLSGKDAEKLAANTVCYWKVVASNAAGETESIAPHKRFVIDPSLPPGPELPATPYAERPKDQALTLAPLAGHVRPEYGKLLDARGWKPAPGLDGKPDGSIELDGESGRVRYRLLAFPERDFTVAIWVAVTRLPKTNYGQVFSAWCRGMDDPLRLVVHGRKLYARIEAGKAFGTKGVPVEVGKWMHVAGVKEGGKLTLYVNGKAHSSARAPDTVVSGAEDFALGANPHYGGPEFLAARLADLRFYARALSAEQVQRLFRSASTR